MKTSSKVQSRVRDNTYETQNLDPLWTWFQISHRISEPLLDLVKTQVWHCVINELTCREL